MTEGEKARARVVDMLKTTKPRRYCRMIAVHGDDGVTYRFRAERIWLVRQVDPPVAQHPDVYVYFRDEVKE